MENHIAWKYEYSLAMLILRSEPRASVRAATKAYRLVPGTQQYVIFQEMSSASEFNIL